MKQFSVIFGCYFVFLGKVESLQILKVIIKMLSIQFSNARTSASERFLDHAIVREFSRMEMIVKTIALPRLISYKLECSH